MFERLKDALRRSNRSPDNVASDEHLSDDQLLAHWQTVSCDDRRVDCFDLPGGRTPDGVVLFLHGHGQVMLNHNPVYSRLFAEHRLAAICPDGGRSWWLDLPTPEFPPDQTPQSWLLDSILPMIQERWQLTTPRIALMGVSMGGQGILQLAYRQASRFPVVAAIAPAVDFHQMHGQGLPLDDIFPDAEAARQATVILNLHPLAWPRYQFFCCDPADVEWFDGVARLGMKLSSSGILHERDLETSHGGHSWDYFNHMAPKVVGHIATSLGKIAAEAG